MSQKWSVKSLVAYLKLKLDNDFLIQNVEVEGEISNFNYHNNRHMYFTLKDESSRISCVMFQSQARTVPFTPKDGMKITVTANVSIFEASGSLQLYVKQMQEVGVGNLAAKFEALKKQLNEEGLFSSEHKKKFKKYPKSIAVISGKDSAALNDILTTLNRRWPVSQVDVYTSLVQGPTAHRDIINKLQLIDDQNYDAIILARGGGSIEDLWAFNEEQLARVIYNLETPIVSGVGHEIDFTISDFVSDLRAPTPTAAAELITPDIVEVRNSFKTYQRMLHEKMLNSLNNSTQLLYTYSNKPIFMHPELLTNQYVKILQQYKNKLVQYKDKQLNDIKAYEHIKNSFMKHLSSTMTSESLNLNTINNSLHNNMKTYHNSVKHIFKAQLSLLDSYSPINTLKRGYSIVESDNTVITSIDSIDANDDIKITVSDGSITAKVLKKEKQHG